MTQHEQVGQAPPIPVSVVVQTHWDREWYLPHQSFIARMLRVVESIVCQLEAGQLDSFLFDGQTAAMEDLFEHAEAPLAARVRQLAADGRIVLGPWYVMADEFLASGEALLRNLELGMRDAAALGSCQKVGYLPDTFGHVSQMPQMLATAGIGSAVLWRGADAEHAEFDWVGLDGTVTPTIFLTEGYYQHPFNVDNWEQALDTYLAQIAPRSLSGQLLLTQGGDHLLSRADLGERIAVFNAGQSGYRLAQSTLAAFVDSAVAASAGRRSRIDGELRRNRQAFVLPDVLSTRRYLKRLNQQAEDRLLGAIEPLFAQLDVPLPAAYLEKCWRILIQQQAHDSICGCSVDAVHDEMRTRYTLLDQRFDALLERAQADAGMIALAHADGHADGPFADFASFTLFNPQPHHIDGWRTYSLFLKGERATGLAIVRDDGAALEAVVIDALAHSELRSPLDDFPDPVHGWRYEVAIRTVLRGLQALACTATPAATAPQVDATASAIENDSVRLVVDAGALRWTDKASGHETNDPLVFLSEFDAGDSYNFSPPPEQQQRLQDRYTLLGTRTVGPLQEMTLAIAMTLPHSLEQRGTLVRSSGVLRLRLWQDRPGVECRLDWDNQARDQRTRLLMPVAPGLAHTVSDSAFSWARRPVVLADYPKSVTRSEMPVCVNPSYSAIEAGELSFCHRAMQEYEVLDHAGRRWLGVTLVRSVGWLSRRDLVTRGVGAGPDLATPGAQCLGTEWFDFLVGRHGGDALREARLLRRPALLLRGHSQRWRAPFEIDSALEVSAVRPRAEGIELRVFNPTGATVGGVKAFGIATIAVGEPA
jgi:mannosylglycerate hydrolase